MYKVGQYVFITFPFLSVRSFFESHPFTLTSGPDELTGEVNIRGLGDFTRSIQEYCRNATPEQKKKLWISVQGPYGNIRLTYWRYPSNILVSAGIGIAPVISILKDCYRFGDLPGHLKDRNPLNVMQSIIVVWIIPDPTNFAWFSQELNEFYAFAEQNPHFPALNVWIYFSKPASDATPLTDKLCPSIPRDNFRFGKPSFDDILGSALDANQGIAHLVFACGPANMVNAVWDSANLQKIKGNRFDFHHETFNW